MLKDLTQRNLMGNDASGRHCAAIDVFDTDLSLNPIQVGNIAVEEHQEALVQFHHFLKQVKPGIVSRIIGKTRRLKKNGDPLTVSPALKLFVPPTLLSLV